MTVAENSLHGLYMGKKVQFCNANAYCHCKLFQCPHPPQQSHLTPIQKRSKQASGKAVHLEYLKMRGL